MMNCWSSPPTWLRPGGQLAIQVPANSDHPSHAIAHELAQESPFRHTLGEGFREPAVQRAEDYSRLLHRIGFREQQVRLQVYPHVLASTTDVVEWTKGTLLTWCTRSNSNLKYSKIFLGEYTARLTAALPERIAVSLHVQTYSALGPVVAQGSGAHKRPTGSRASTVAVCDGTTS